MMRNPLRDLSPRDRRAIVLGLVVLVPALLWVGVVRPYRAYLEELHERTAAERALLTRERALLARADALPAVLADAESAAQRLELRLVRAPNTPLAEAELTSYLESVATASRTLLKDIRAVGMRRAEPDAAGDLRPIRLAITAESDLEGIVTFISRVENSPLLVRIGEFSLEPVNGGAANAPGARARPTGVMHLMMVVEAYAPAEPAEPPVVHDAGAGEREVTP